MVLERRTGLVYYVEKSSFDMVALVMDAAPRRDTPAAHITPQPARVAVKSHEKTCV
jgi:hypothetical protein